MPRTSQSPPASVLKRLHEEHGGDITAVARSLGRPVTSVRQWCRNIGLQAKGVGSPVPKKPTRAVVLELHEKHRGNSAAAGQDYGVSHTAMHTWFDDEGLRSTGHLSRRDRFTPIYPMELDGEVIDGDVVIFSDPHFWPGERTVANEALLRVCRMLKPVMLIANGDVLDGSRVSRHDPIGWDDLPKLHEELTVCQERMAEVSHAARGARRIFVLGNHDARFEKYLIKNAPELEGVEGMRLGHHFPGWEVCWSIRLNSDVMVKHRYKGGAHATYNNVMRAGLSIVTGHLHSQKASPWTDYRGTRWGVDPGTLADPNGPQFLYVENNPTDWRSGFAVLRFRKGVLLPPALATVMADGSCCLSMPEAV